MVNGASYNFPQTQRLYVIVDIDTARRCSGVDVDEFNGSNDIVHVW